MNEVKICVQNISNNVIQIIGQSNYYDPRIQMYLTRKIGEFSQKAELYNGIPQQENPKIMGQKKILVHATYQFLSGNDMFRFLQECENLK